MKKNTLLVGSKSASRKQLLEEAEIPFTLINQDIDETQCDWSQSLTEVVKSIAQAKMDHLVLPQGQEDEHAYFLTADTLSRDVSDGIIRGKPSDKLEARAMIKAAQQGSNIATAFCIDVKVWRNGTWLLVERHLEVVTAEYLFYVPDYLIETYLNRSRGLQASGAIAIEGYGAQFLRLIHGSYSAIVGLPMFEVRNALERYGFFK